MRLILATILLALCGPVSAQILIPYGLAKEFGFCLYDYTTPNEKESTVTFEAADVKVSQSGTEANSANSPSDDGDCFKLTLAATETDTAWVHVLIDDDDNVWLPIDIRFETYGDPAAANPTLGTNVTTYGQAQSGTPTGIVLAAATSFADHFLEKKRICITRNTGAGQCRGIVIWTNTGDAATIDDAWDVDPDSTSFYVVYSDNQAFADLDANGVIKANAVKFNGDANAAAGAEVFFETNTVTTASGLPTDVTTAILAATIEAGVNLKCALALTLSYTADWANSGQSTTYRNMGNTANRVTITRAVDGNSVSVSSFTCPP